MRPYAMVWFMEHHLLRYRMRRVLRHFLHEHRRSPRLTAAALLRFKNTPSVMPSRSPTKSQRATVSEPENGAPCRSVALPANVQSSKSTLP